MDPAKPPPTHRLRAAVLGASGIGRYHVRELTRAGADVVAIGGSRPESAARSAERLERLWGVRPRALAHLDEVLEQDLDLVCIATPHELHFDACVRALGRGLWVFCEKPLFWKAGLDVGEARAMLAELSMVGADRRLCVNTSNATFVRRLVDDGRVARSPRRFSFELWTAGRDSGEAIATDLLPHALSLVRELEPEADLADLRSEVGRHAFRASFRAGDLAVSFVLGKRPGAAKRMVLGFDDTRVERVQRVERGEYRVFLRLDGVDHEVADPFAAYWRGFLAAVRGQGELPVSFERSSRILLDALRLLDAGRSPEVGR